MTNAITEAEIKEMQAHCEALAGWELSEDCSRLLSERARLLEIVRGLAEKVSKVEAHPKAMKENSADRTENAMEAVTYNPELRAKIGETDSSAPDPLYAAAPAMLKALEAIGEAELGNPVYGSMLKALKLCGEAIRLAKGTPSSGDTTLSKLAGTVMGKR